LQVGAGTKVGGTNQNTIVGGAELVQPNPRRIGSAFPAWLAHCTCLEKHPLQKKKFEKRPYLSISIILFSSLLLFPLLTSSSHSAEPIIPDDQTRDRLVAYLRDISDWAVTIELGSGELKIPTKWRTSIFVNSNLARMLIAAYEITGESRYLHEALGWFDRLVALQQKTVTISGDTSGYWGDHNPNKNIYLGDAGTTATALAGAVRFAEGERRSQYLKALHLYANFVRLGTRADPQNKGRGGSEGWIIKQGENAGAIGCGYYRDELSLAPYTISTSVTGASFFSCYYILTGERLYLKIAEDAGRWLMSIRERSGEIPYILHNSRLDQWPLDTMSYVADGMIGLYQRTDDENLRKEMKTSLARSVQWLLNLQNPSGTWGKLRSDDQQRSQGVLNLLVWYYSEISPNPQILNSIRKNYSYFLQPENSTKFGIKELPITTGFVGLGIAEVLTPGITYRLE